jgi:hypothetical protein
MKEMTKEEKHRYFSKLGKKGRGVVAEIRESITPAPT